MSSAAPPATLPAWVQWEQRTFPNANLLLLHGRQPALVDSGFVAHADETLQWSHAHAGDVALVVNTHWHSDHVGGNGALQAAGAGIAASGPDAEAIRRRDPGCCSAQRLDQPVPPYTVDLALQDGQVLTLGDAEWQVVRTPGHTQGHLCLWQAEDELLVVGDALSDYDVGWVDLALDGPAAAATALSSLQRLHDLQPRVLLPSHGPVPLDTGAALAAALRRAQRLVDDRAGAVWYGARRVFAFALMIKGGIPPDDVEAYLHAREWLVDAAELLGRSPESLAEELVRSMHDSGAVVLRNGRLHAAAPHAPAPTGAELPPFPSAWPPSPRGPEETTRA